MQIKHKINYVSGVRPALTELAYGELAINAKDGKLYLKRGQGGSDPGTIELASGEMVSIELNTVDTAWALRGREAAAQAPDSISFARTTSTLSSSTGAQGENSVVLGTDTLAQGIDSIAIGTGTQSTENSNFAIGRFNNPQTNTVFEVGIGTELQRQNALEVYGSGLITSPGSSIQSIDTGGTKTVITKEYLLDKLQNQVLNMNDLGDVNLSSPSNGDTLVWNGTSSEWENSNVLNGGTF